MFKSLLTFALLASSVTAFAYQDPNELQARADRYARQQQAARDAEFKRTIAAEESRFQSSGGRIELNQGLRNALSSATGQDMSEAFWQAKRTKSGKYARSENMAIITNRGFYCFRTWGGFTRSNYSCYYDNGAPYLSFEHRFDRDGT
jgi:hypothetical protein